ncbi:Formyltransferase [Cristinia sonorae]|uniref:methionyl-tRNA formyltransferase n=1 Tax=Cristinia sonorae TaxID=1940300 RepID=A0A8K0UGD6_9AGAR|nr:Formyltransferase [Cristinia sonorae]
MLSLSRGLPGFPHALLKPSRGVRLLSTSPFKVLFFGRDEFSCVVLDHLYSAREIWSSIDVVTTPDIRIGRRGSKLAVSPLKSLGDNLRLPIHTIPAEKAAFRHWPLPHPFAPSDAPPNDHLLLTASFGRILSNAHLSAFGVGRKLNVHPSLLPAYRGAAPIQHALIDGRKETGVSVIEMTERKKGLDAGHIWGMTRSSIPQGADFVSLREQLAIDGGRLLVDVLKKMLAGTAVPKPQLEDPNAPRAPLLTPQDSLIDFSTMSAETIVRRHRGISHQRPLFTHLKSGKTLQLFDLSVCTPESGAEELTSPGMAKYHHRLKGLIVRCMDDSFLLVSQVKPQDRVLVKAKEWWNGVRPADRALTDALDGPILLTREFSALRP